MVTVFLNFFLHGLPQAQASGFRLVDTESGLVPLLSPGLLAVEKKSTPLIVVCAYARDRNMKMARTSENSLESAVH